MMTFLVVITPPQNISMGPFI